MRRLHMTRRSKLASPPTPPVDSHSKMKMIITNTLAPAFEWEQHHKLKHGPVPPTNRHPTITPKATIRAGVRKVNTAEGARMHRSLNLGARKKEQMNILKQNSQIVKRISSQRSHYAAQSMQEKWQQQKRRAQSISHYPFILRDNAYSRKGSRKPSIDRQRAIQDTIRLRRIRIIEGQKALLMLTLDDSKMRVIAEVIGGDPKVIEVPRKEALQFIDFECNGQIQRIFDCLAYDPEQNVLYLIGKDAVEAQGVQDN